MVISELYLRKEKIASLSSESACCLSNVSEAIHVECKPFSIDWAEYVDPASGIWAINAWIFDISVNFFIYFFFSILFAIWLELMIYLHSQHVLSYSIHHLLHQKNQAPNDPDIHLRIFHKPIHTDLYTRLYLCSPIRVST